tara:strand:- start:564 stop:725 length:162 start_codon:yes stop_codon:yes gene_type:complete
MKIKKAEYFIIDGFAYSFNVAEDGERIIIRLGNKKTYKVYEKIDNFHENLLRG